MDNTVAATQGASRPSGVSERVGSGTEFRVAGRGSMANVIAAVCSFFVPGLGQLVQGRVLMALLQFVLAGVLWFFLLGWIIHLWSIIDAAIWKPRR